MTGSSISLDEFVRTLDPAVAEIEMFGPSLHIETADNAFGRPGTLLWRADIDVTHLDSRMGDPDIRVGQIDFVMARTGVDGLADELLDREKFHRLRTDRFAPLFDDHRIGPELAQQFSDPVEVVMLVLWGVVDPALRGHRLGAWALCQAIETMMPTSNGLILMHPHWDAEADPAPTVEQLETVDRLNRYWETTGLVPLQDRPQFLAQHANRYALQTAIEAYQRRFYTDDYTMSTPIAPIRQRVDEGFDFL
ncbi:hypothetical protein BH09ACT8_BH09ACT8_51100 [soil metagenome]|jgi:hypothetical protein